MTDAERQQLAAEFMRTLDTGESWTAQLAALLERVYYEGYEEGLGHGYSNGSQQG